MQGFFLFVLMLLFPVSLYGGEVMIAGYHFDTLQGKWEGETSFRATGGSFTPTTLIIFNDRVPLKGVLRDLYDHPFDNGTIVDGKLVIKWERKTVVLTLDDSEGHKVLKGITVWNVPEEKESGPSLRSASAQIFFMKTQTADLIPTAFKKQ